MKEEVSSTAHYKFKYTTKSAFSVSQRKYNRHEKNDRERNRHLRYGGVALECPQERHARGDELTYLPKVVMEIKNSGSANDAIHAMKQVFSYSYCASKQTSNEMVTMVILTPENWYVGKFSNEEHRIKFKSFHVCSVREDDEKKIHCFQMTHFLKFLKIFEDHVDKSTNRC